MLCHLNVHHLRNLHSVSIDCGQCNVFIGKNGSGKTSLLESLNLLSRGKSFRHAQPKRYISHHQPTVTVHARFDDGTTMAIQKAQDASTQLRLGQQVVYVQSALARELPALLIDPSSMDVLEVGSSQRRQLLDWITFHVEPDFHPQWVAYQRLLKQRNALLKQSATLSDSQLNELKAWDNSLSVHAKLITQYREQVFKIWQPLFNSLVAELLPDYAPFIQLRFSAGYNTEVSLGELFSQRIEQDHHLGYTRIGCHRADVQVLWLDDAKDRAVDAKADQQLCDDNSISDTLQPPIKNLREQASNVLSRGEKKLLITALRLSQLPLLTTQQTNTANTNYNSLTTRMPLVLLDDITAELDNKALEILLKTLSKTPCQLFITSLEQTIVENIRKYWQSIKLFHVEQGKVIANNSLIS